MLNTMALACLSTVLIVLAAALFATTARANPTSRIIGGEDADISAHAVSLRLDNAHVCGGTVIGLRFILTAANCVVDDSTGKPFAANRLSVRVGSTNQFASGKVHYVETVTPNPEYNDYDHNIAIVSLLIPVTPSDKIRIIDISKSAEDQPPEGADVMVAGWGQQSTLQGDTPFKLQEKTFTVANDEVCLEANENADDSNLCLEHDLKEGSCKGDAGNGGIYNNKVVAVCSFIIGACGSKYPEVFADVSFYSEWIQSIIG